MELYRKIDECLGKIAPIAFIILTFYVCLNRIPFYDEAHSFLISQFSLKEIFYLARVEGHPILSRYNINPIAVKYGGGGHQKASGATLKNKEEAMALLSDLNSLSEAEQC